MIYIVAHKKFEIPDVDDSYNVIYVGEKMGEYAVENGYLSDRNEEDNIADKNAFYCELTALYYIWKHDMKSEFIGINHYRRYFLSKNSSGSILTKNEIEGHLKEKHIILPTPITFKCTIEKFYLRTAGYEKDILSIRKIIQENYPEYSSSLSMFLEGHKMSYANMFVMRREDFEGYCEWLFDILFKVEKDMDLTSYTQSEARVYGYLGELLLNVYVLKNNLKEVFLDIFNTEKISFGEVVKAKVKQIVKMIIYFPSGIPLKRRL